MTMSDKTSPHRCLTGKVSKLIDLGDFQAGPSRISHCAIRILETSSGRPAQAIVCILVSDIHLSTANFVIAGIVPLNPEDSIKNMDIAPSNFVKVPLDPELSLNFVQVSTCDICFRGRYILLGYPSNKEFQKWFAAIIPLAFQKADILEKRTEIEGTQDETFTDFLAEGSKIKASVLNNVVNTVHDITVGVFQASLTALLWVSDDLILASFLDGLSLLLRIEKSENNLTQMLVLKKYHSWFLNSPILSTYLVRSNPLELISQVASKSGQWWVWDFELSPNLVVHHEKFLENVTCIPRWLQGSEEKDFHLIESSCSRGKHFRPDLLCFDLAGQRFLWTSASGTQSWVRTFFWSLFFFIDFLLGGTNNIILEWGQFWSFLSLDEADFEFLTFNL